MKSRRPTALTPLPKTGKDMKRGITLLLGGCLFGSAYGLGTSHRTCGIAWNGIPAVADTAAGRIYVSLPPDVPADLTGEWTCDGLAGQFRLDNEATFTAQAGCTARLTDWRRPGHTLTHLQANGGQRRWELCFTTLPLVCVDADMEQLEWNYLHDPDTKRTGHFALVDPQCLTDGVHPLCAHTIGIRIRGATSGRYPKKSFTIEFQSIFGGVKKTSLCWLSTTTATMYWMPCTSTAPGCATA